MKAMAVLTLCGLALVAAGQYASGRAKVAICVAGWIIVLAATLAMTYMVCE